MARVCVIGAGSSGIAAAQVLNARGVSFDCFEAGSEVGGNWRYHNDNDMSSAYRSLRANSSRKAMQYATFPIPDSYPDYLHHTMVARYLDDFVDHFGFRDRIRFRTEVTRVEPVAGGGWRVTARQRDTGQESIERYDGVLVANGHHWEPRYPRPAIPGSDAFGGTQLHSHCYRTPEPFAGRRVLILGIGNSACDIAAECSQVAERTVLAMRRGAHIVPKYLFGRPTDHLTLMRLGARVPLPLQRWAVGALLRTARGTVTGRGLPRPDHRLLCSPPTVSDRLLGALDQGRIVVRPAIDRFGTDRVHFTDGTAEQVDAVIYCTGYKISFPFLDPALISAEGNQVPLYRRVVPKALPGLYFIVLVQPIGATMPIAEAQSEWVADLLEGRAALPDQAQMTSEIARYRAANARRYAPSSRPAIQVDFLAYLREIARERRAGAKRTVARRVLAAPRPAPRALRQASSASQA
jgi:thioredoxin reductase